PRARDDCGSGPRRIRARARRDPRPPDDGERRAAPPSGQRHARDARGNGPPRARQPQSVLRRRAAARPGGVSDEPLALVETPEYLRRTAGLLHDCFRDVIRTHQPEIERVLAGERSALLENLRTEIELLWLTGELRLTKPTVEQELAWGLYFVNENLFEVVPELVDKLESALRQAYPAHHFDVPPFFQFGSWIGGDRDGNPFVTNDVTRRTLFDNRIASLRRYPQRVCDLRRALSVTERATPIAAEFREALAR